MGMDMDSGDIRELSDIKDLLETEAAFRVNETLHIKGGHFRVIGIIPSPHNEIILKGISKEEFQLSQDR